MMWIPVGNMNQQDMHHHIYPVSTASHFHTHLCHIAPSYCRMSWRVHLQPLPRSMYPHCTRHLAQSDPHLCNTNQQGRRDIEQC